jgi:hypothetical protein
MLRPFRTYNAEKLQQVAEPHSEDWIGFDADELLSNPLNICLTNEEESDFSLFEYDRAGIYTGHFIYTSRGKAALRFGQKCLEVIFSDFPVTLIKGLTPVEHLGARWLSRKLGFQSFGVIDTIKGPHELVMLTRKGYTDNE